MWPVSFLGQCWPHVSLLYSLCYLRRSTLHAFVRCQIVSLPLPKAPGNAIHLDYSTWHLPNRHRVVLGFHQKPRCTHIAHVACWYWHLCHFLLTTPFTTPCYSSSGQWETMWPFPPSHSWLGENRHLNQAGTNASSQELGIGIKGKRISLLTCLGL